jgi:hypothetical protein
MASIGQVALYSGLGIGGGILFGVQAGSLAGMLGATAID